jgi:HlyD family secretion protein
MCVTFRCVAFELFSACVVYHYMIPNFLGVQMQTQPKTTVVCVTGRRARRFKLMALIAAVLVIAVGIGCFVLWRQNQQQAAAAKQSTIVVSRGTVEVKVSATGTIRPDKEVKVSPKQMGLVKQLLVRQGDYVKRGQALAQMDDVNMRAQLASSQAAYLIAKDQYEKALRGNRPQEVAAAEFQAARTEKAVQAAQQNVARLRLQLQSLEAQAARDARNAQRQVMLAQQGAVSDQDRLNASTQATVTQTQLEMARQELAQAQLQVGEAQAEMAASRQTSSMIRSGNRAEDISAAKHAMLQAEANVNQIKVQLDDMTVRAPFDGVITQKYADEGAIVTPTTSAATTSATSSSIVSLAGSLEMVAQVSEADISKIELGQEVEIVANALPGKTFHGFVTQIAPAAIVTSNVTTFEVHAAIDENDKELLSGMNVSVKFISGREENALLVPTVAIVSRRGQPGVLLVREAGKEPEWTPVVIGPTVENKTVIRGGINEGDKIAMGLDKDGLEKFRYSRNRPGGMGAMSPFGGMGRGMGGMGGGGRRGGGF